MHSTARNLHEEADSDFWDKLWRCAGYAQTQDGDYVRMKAEEIESMRLSIPELEALVEAELADYLVKVEEDEEEARAKEKDEDWSRLMEYARIGDLHKAMV